MNPIAVGAVAALCFLVMLVDVVILLTALLDWVAKR